MRSGMIGQKVGMTRVFNNDGKHIPVTVLKVNGCKVVSQRNLDKDGYVSVQVALPGGKPKNMSKALKGNLKKSGLDAVKKIREYRVSDDCVLNVGDEIKADHFIKGQYVDVTGTSIGKGFAGSMKRHNFAGGRATHGVSKAHRAHGSTGHCEFPAKVFKGKKMAGHMGAERKTVQNLEVVEIDILNGLILVKGAVPGSKGGIVFIKDAVKKELSKDAPLPGSVESSKTNSVKEEKKEDLETKNETADNASGNTEKKSETKIDANADKKEEVKNTETAKENPQEEKETKTDEVKE